MFLHPDDINNGYRTIVQGPTGWDIGQTKGKGFWAEYIHSNSNNAGGEDYWSKGKLYFKTAGERNQYVANNIKKRENEAPINTNSFFLIMKKNLQICHGRHKKTRT